VAGWDGTTAAIANPPSHGWYFTCFPGATTQPPLCKTYGETGCAYVDLQNTITHEVGHVIGLAHSPVAGATMSATTAPREITKRDLAADDVAAVCAVYPHGSGGCGCGSAEAAGAGSLVLAALALRRPRRRPARRIRPPGACRR
jgi:MYXO-CTERM domain-containing protein